MAIVRWNPFKEFDYIQDRMNRLFGETPFKPLREEGLFQGNWIPAVDVFEDEDCIKIDVEIPGLKKEDLDIQLHENILTIKGERKFEHEDKKDNYHRIERGYGNFVRTFTLPNTVSQEKIGAGYKEGILTITLPKTAEAKPRQISVSVE